MLSVKTVYVLSSLQLTIDAARGTVHLAALKALEECEPMFITFFVPLEFFLLLAARKPREYRTVIAFAAWQSLAHSAFQSQFLKQFGKRCYMLEHSD